jgi:bifunctional ADP-heptose synthase (sugar kinase/adenylyltransferase)
MTRFKVLVVGETCDDIFHYGASTRLCPDVPAPVFQLKKSSSSEGMAGNTARNLKALGVEVDLISQKEHVSKTRYVEEQLNYTFLRVDSGEENITPFSSYSDLLADDEIVSYDAVVISDYGKGFLSEQDIERFCTHNKKTFIDTKKVLKDPLGSYCEGAAFVKINSSEFEGIKNKMDLDKWRNRLIVTLGDRGCMYYTDNGFRYFPVDTVNVFDLSGAGDTFLAALVWKYLQSNDISKSIECANFHASKAVQQKGVAVIDAGSDTK